MGIIEELAFIQWLTGFGSDLAAQLGGTVSLVPTEADFGENRFPLDHVGQRHRLGYRYSRGIGFGRGNLLGHPDVVEVPGAVKIAHVVIDTGPTVLVTDPDADVRANEIVRHGGRAGMPDHDRINFGRLRAAGILGECR